ncbi:MAG: hypothetical protein Q8O84_01435 [Nanoarchaeota archaeon]|nr:hypothetical protein [Nanoarchaeota archaeon]
MTIIKNLYPKEYPKEGHKGHEEKKIKLENEIEFIKAIKISKVSVDNIFDDRAIKENLLRDYKRYNKLNSFVKYKKIFEYCSDARLGLAFKKDYYFAKNKIKKGMCGS